MAHAEGAGTGGAGRAADKSVMVAGVLESVDTSVLVCGTDWLAGVGWMSRVAGNGVNWQLLQDRRWVDRVSADASDASGVMD